MEELDELARRDLLTTARQALEKEFKAMELENKSILDRIEAKKKELRGYEERVEAAKIQSDEELKRVATETVTERERISAQNDTIKVELAQLQSKKNKAESEWAAASAAHILLIEKNRSELQLVRSALASNQDAVRECRAILAKMKAILQSVDL